MSQSCQITEQLFVGDSEMARLMRAGLDPQNGSLDWSQTPLGPVETWSQSLLTSLGICLMSQFPILIWWGPELVMFYNDAYCPILGATKHPKALGQKGAECWLEAWHRNYCPSDQRASAKNLTKPGKLGGRGKDRHRSVLPGDPNPEPQSLRCSIRVVVFSAGERQADSLSQCNRHRGRNSRQSSHC